MQLRGSGCEDLQFSPVCFRFQEVSQARGFQKILAKTIENDTPFQGLFNELGRLSSSRVGRSGKTRIYYLKNVQWFRLIRLTFLHFDSKHSAKLAPRQTIQSGLQCEFGTDVLIANDCPRRDWLSCRGSYLKFYTVSASDGTPV